MESGDTVAGIALYADLSKLARAALAKAKGGAA